MGHVPTELVERIVFDALDFVATTQVTDQTVEEDAAALAAGSSNQSHVTMPAVSGA